MAEIQGYHYKYAPGEQHHERVTRLRLNWYASNITKYAERAHMKGQLVEDLIKVIDYACMWLASTDKETMPTSLTAQQLDRIDSIVRKVVPQPAPPAPDRYDSQRIHNETQS